ncbi:MAG TPA: SLC13 family permease [Opitutales bacterium]|nr:SLC13 family permease [Opitutales bacterium]
MTWEIGLLLVIVFVVFVLLVREILPSDLVALGALVLVSFTGLITPAEAFQSFANEAPITVGAMFVLSFALQRTGLIEELGVKLRLMPRMGEKRLAFSLMVLVAGVSAFLNNTPVVVAFMPLVLGLAKYHQVSASKLLIPLSFGAIFGGTCTLIGTSTNLAVSSMAGSRYGIEIGMFDITLPGVVMATTGILYMTFIGRHLLPAREPLATLVDDASGRLYFAEVEASRKSGWLGRRLGETELATTEGVWLNEVRRNQIKISGDPADVELEEGDRILVSCHLKSLLALQTTRGLVVHNARTAGNPDPDEDTRVLEVVVTNNSALAGQSIQEVRFQERAGVQVLAVHRQGEQLRGNLGRLRLRFGDTLLLKVPQAAMLALRETRSLLVLSDLPLLSPRTNKKWIVLGTFATMVGLAAAGVYPISLLALGAVLFLAMTRSIRVSEIYEAIDWRVVTMIIGMISLGTAMEKTGTASWVAGLTVGVADDLHPLFLLAAVYLVTTTLTEMISNNAVAILMTPIAMETAVAYGVSPMPFLIAIMFGASASFATPIGYQTNTFVYGAGGYKFSDFLRVGIPLNFVYWIVATLVIPLFYPL